MARKKGATEIDVSGSGFIDDRGRHVNTDIPEDARRSSSGKSNSKQRLKDKQSKAAKRKKEIEEENEQAKAPSQRKKKKKKEDTYSLDPEKEKARKRKKKDSDTKKKEKEAEKADGKKKKRKKKTVGQLLKEGKTEQARKKASKLSSKALTVANESESGELIQAESAGDLMPSALNSEAEFLQEYYHIYGTLGSIIRNLEKRMTEPNSQVNSKDVYALMTMYSQMRETIADLRSIKDMNEQAEELAKHVFDPAAKSAGESLVGLYFKVSSSIRQSVNDPAVVEALIESLKGDVGEQASNLQDQFDVARSRIVDILNGGA